MTRPKVPDDPHAFLQAVMRNDFRAFLRKAFASIRGGATIAWNWHLDAIACQLGRVESGENRHLLVTMPPRNLKSITISVAWVAWMLGRDPRRNFVCVSYSNDLSAKLAYDCLTLMQTGWYRELFPSTVISQRRSAISDFETTAGGGRLATSLTGTVTGRGGDIVIIDDPIKPEEANSEVTRNNTNERFRSTLASRLDDKGVGAVIVVMQRLHQFDLAGMLIEGGGWHQLSLPAIAIDSEKIQLCGGRLHRREPGDVLHPEREPLHVLATLRQLMGPLNFDAQYQQQPVPADGNIIKANWLRIYEAGFDPSREPGEIIQSWDTASKDGATSDWSVCVTAHVWHGTVRVLDVFRARLAFPELKVAYVELAKRFGARTILVEDAASGMQLIQSIKAERPRGVQPPVPRRPEGDKVSRVVGMSGQVAAGQLLLPDNATWVAGFRSELLGFPRVRHDDQVDALAQLMNWVLQREMFAHEPMSAGPILFIHHRDGSEEIIGDIDGIFSNGRQYTGDPWSGVLLGD